MNFSEKSYLRDLLPVAQAIYDQDWAEANAGNLSVRLDCAQLQDRADFSAGGPVLPLAVAVAQLAGEYFLVTAAGSHLRSIPRTPQTTCGVVRITDDGAGYQVVWGFGDGGAPTSEFSAHLQSHAVRKPLGDRALLHTHPVTLLGLCHTKALDTASLTKLLWSMHPEGVCLYPDGIAYTPFLVSGTLPLADATCHAFRSSGMVLWDYHGVFAAGRDLDHAFGKVQAAEKAAKIYQAACMMGGVTRALSAADIRAVADNFGLRPLEGVLSQEAEPCI